MPDNKMPSEEVIRLRTELEKKKKSIENLNRAVTTLISVKQELNQKNEILAEELKKAQQGLKLFQQEIEKLTAPPNGYAFVVRVVDKEKRTVDIFFDNRSGRQMVTVIPAININDLKFGVQVRLNEANVIIAIDNDLPLIGSEAYFDCWIDKDRLRVTEAVGDEKLIVFAADSLPRDLDVGDALRVYGGFALEKLEKTEAKEYFLEEIPDTTFNNIGGLKKPIEALLEAIEYPALYPEYFALHKLKPTKGILIYGPPGCGKTLMAKAAANRLAQRLREKTGDANVTAYFMNIKGPELLNKYVGETEREIREIFQVAQKKATTGYPVIIFFDEFESLFRVRGSGISSDVESTIVPQFLSMMDGVEELHNVIVIGASNRQDLIDPAVLRPGRFDLKIKVDRPDESGAKEIFEIYITPDLPWGNDSNGQPYIGQKEHSVIDYLRNNKRYIVDLSTPELMVKHVINTVVDYLYYTGPPISWMNRRNNKHEYNTECIETTWADATKKTLYVKDILVSGAIINNIVNRVKKMAIKRLIITGEKGIQMVDFYTAIRDEIKENSDLPNTNNPDDWAKIIGQCSETGSKIVSVRFLGTQQVIQSKKIETVSTGHYL